MRKLTAQEIAEGAKRFLTRTRDPLQMLVERLLPIEYITETDGDATVVKARITDRDGKVWEGSARGSSSDDLLNRQAFYDLRDVMNRAARRLPRGEEGDLRRLRKTMSFPTLDMKLEQRRWQGAGMKFGMDEGLQMYAQITDETGREWKVSRGDLLDLLRAMRAQLENAVANGDAAAKALLVKLDARPPPKQRPSSSSKRRSEK